MRGDHTGLYRASSYDRFRRQLVSGFGGGGESTQGAKKLSRLRGIPRWRSRTEPLNLLCLGH